MGKNLVSTHAVKFIIDGLWFIAIILLIGTVVTLVKKQTFDTIHIYDTGIGFFDSKNEMERYALYSDIKLSYGKMKESFWVESKTASVKLTDYGWREFSQSDVLRNSLERYGKWS